MEEAKKLFRLPGTIEEQEKKESSRAADNRESREALENVLRVDSPLLGHKSATYSSLPRNITLIRVSTQSSSIAGNVAAVGRQDSTR